ncbi:hypothetical protein F4778DRAFT_724942 [Xylariomycetidae sp. FL2044]|nr:hypothetical protein F4778DRAFT_724942 [Xylariomycetidae sp. FL2044]
MPLIRPPSRKFSAERHEHARLVDMWMVEYELERLKKEDGLLRRTRSVKEQKRKKSMTDELGDVFEDRDIVFLVDNGHTMRQHWNHARYLLRVLVWRAWQYDNDGMDLCFTDPASARHCIKGKKNQTRNEFTRAMDAAKPDESTNKETTGIIPALDRLIQGHSHAAKPKTILILTDGIWAGIGDENIDTLIKSSINMIRRESLSSDDRLLTRRPITFQFIRFGDDRDAIERLRRLDDGLKDQGYPDLVDTEPAIGDVYKMFLGSIFENMDQTTNIANASSHLSLMSVQPSSSLVARPSFDSFSIPEEPRSS